VGLGSNDGRDIDRLVEVFRLHADQSVGLIGGHSSLLLHPVDTKAADNEEEEAEADEEPEKLVEDCLAAHDPVVRRHSRVHWRRASQIIVGFVSSI